RNNTNFVTELLMQYGKQKNKDQQPRKNNDRVFWDNKLSLKVSNHWSLFTSLTFESQFDMGLTYGSDGTVTDTISNFMAPGYLTESLGIEYTPDNTFSLRIGTGTGRQPFILDEPLVPRNGATRFGVEP